MNRLELIRQRLAALQPIRIELEDDSHLHAGHTGAQSGGGHYRLHIVSEQFAGKSTLARHRMVYCALGEMMQHDVHAINIKANTPNEAQ